jgi:hypothetical protein
MRQQCFRATRTTTTCSTTTICSGIKRMRRGTSLICKPWKRMAAEQTTRDKGALSAQESALRANALLHHYSVQDIDNLQRLFARPGDPETALYAGHSLQQRAQALGLPGPTNQEIDARVRASAKSLADSLQREIDRIVHSAYRLDAADRANIQARIVALRQRVVGTDGKPLLADADLPFLPTSDQIAKIRADERARHQMEMEELAKRRGG